MATLNKPVFSLAAAITTFQNLRLRISVLRISPVQKVRQIYLGEYKYLYSVVGYDRIAGAQNSNKTSSYIRHLNFLLFLLETYYRHFY